MKKVFILLIIISLTFSLSSKSLSIEDLQAMMRENNSSLITQEESVKRAHYDTLDAKGHLSPTVKLSGSASYMFNPPIGPITIESDTLTSQMGLGSVSNEYITLYEGMENTMYSASLSITQPLVTWGKLINAISLYESVESAQSSLYSDSLKRNTAELKMRCYSLSLLDELFSLLELSKEKADELLKIAESGYENGMLIKSELLKAEVESKEVSIKRAQLDNQAFSILDGLRKLVGDYTIERDDLSVEFDDSLYLKYKGQDYSSYLDKAFGVSDALRAAKNQVTAYEYMEKINKKSIYGIPDFAIQADLSLNGSRFPFVESGWRQKGSWGVTLSVGFQTTLWDGGDKLHDIKRAESNKSDAQSQLASAYREIESALKTTLSSMDYSFTNLDYLELKIETAEEELRILNLKDDNGTVSKSDIIQKELEIISLKSESVMEKINLAQYACTLDYLLGEN